LKITAAPQRVEDLLRFLRQIGYVADEVDHGVVQVERAPEQGASAVRVLAIALSLQLRVWNVVNDADARVAEVGRAAGALTTSRRLVADAGESEITSMRRTILERIHNPSGRRCGCPPACWCKRTAWGRALRWCLPRRHLSIAPAWKGPQERG